MIQKPKLEDKVMIVVDSKSGDVTIPEGTTGIFKGSHPENSDYVVVAIKGKQYSIWSDDIEKVEEAAE